jgi:hypothetical protein
MGGVRMKPVRGLFWAKEQRPLKLVPVDSETSIPFTRQPTDRVGSELPGLLMEPLNHRGPAEQANAFHFNNPHVVLIPSISDIKRVAARNSEVLWQQHHLL